MATRKQPKLIRFRRIGLAAHEGFSHTSQPPNKIRCLWCRRYLTDVTPCLSQSTKPLLARHVLAHPTRWKSILRSCWDDTDDFWVRSLRNSLGPKLLAEIKTADILKWETLRKHDQQHLPG